MPTTRSQKSTALQESTPTPVTTATVTTSESAMSTVTTTWSHGTTTTVTDAPRAPGQLEVARAASVKAKSMARSVNKRKEMEARAEVALQEMKAAQAAAAHARAQLELLRLEEEEDSVIEEPIDNEDDVSRWVQATMKLPEEQPEEIPAPAPQNPPKDASGSDSQKLADAIIKAIGATSRPAAIPAFLHDLPQFDGSSSEWLAFKTVYSDTASLFTAVQNMARLRKAIKGTAREAVKSALFSDCSPEEVMEALRRRFGRPEALVLTELDRIRSLPRVTDNPRDVCLFASQVNNSVAAIRGLKMPQYLQSPEMLRHIVEKMSAVTRARWCDYASNREPEGPDLMMVMKFLNREADLFGPYAVQEASKRQASVKQGTHTAIEEEQKQVKVSCSQCRGDHRMLDCRDFLQATVRDRWEAAKKSRLCYKCLQGRHRKENCMKPPCKKCKGRHHVLLHEEKNEKQEENKEVANNVRFPVNTAQSTRAYLKMAPVEIYGPKGSLKILALLDEGSTVTLLDSAVAAEIGLRGPEEGLTLETVGGRQVTKKDSMKVDLLIRGVHQAKKRTLKGARTIDDIRLTPQRINKERLQECAHLRKLAEQLYYEEESPKLLIGQDNWELIVSKSTRKGTKNQPVASYTLLGWVLHGFDGGSAKPIVNFVTCAHVSAQDTDMERLIREHFAIESLGVQPRRPTTDADGKALEILEKSSRRLPNGRFEVGLLWRKGDEQMPRNFKSAESRLKAIEKKLDRDAELKQEYSQQIQNLLDSGYAEEANRESTSTRKWYLPHFTVTHPTKKKRRLVFDAAAKFEGKSLNDALLPGPDLLQSLFGVLLRFRQRPIAVVADIKEMFLQIKIREEDRDSLRFLWRQDRRTGPPQEYRMTSLIFGAACSPSAAIFVKNRNAAEFKEEFPEAARAVERNHYMDDYLHSFHTEKEAIKIASEVDTIHRAAGLHLRGWASNDPNVLRALGHEATACDEVELGSKEEKTLGLRWFTSTDEMGFRTCMRNISQEVADQEATPTKREVTSAVMSTFDPLGLACPVLIQGKRLIQDIWRSGIGWDDRVQPKEEAAWKAYLENLEFLRDLRLPRCIARDGHEGELHVFTDASETAYACAVYWRQRHDNEEYTVTLLAGKARVTPLKPVSIPRLELQAALLGTRMAQAVREELDMKVKDVTYWTDSSTVLAWIKSDPRTFKPFVAHRLAEIEDTSKPQQWRWVPTKQNPADDATRGVPKDFNKAHRWFNGPDFLQKSECSWPRTRSTKAELTGEEKEAHITAAVVAANKSAIPAPDRFSSWMRLVRTTARVLQFIDLCRIKDKYAIHVGRKAESQDPTWRRDRKKVGGKGKIVRSTHREKCFIPIDSVRMVEAERLLLKNSQTDDFGRDISSIQQRKPLSKDSKLRKLAVVQHDGLLCMDGRINAATAVDGDYKRPVILDGKHRITRLLIQYYHEQFNHGNHATVINELRQRYWILGLRTTVKNIVRQCQWCKVYRSAPQQVPTGDLPIERLRHGEPPFTHSAVDYFGPMTVTVGRRHEKRWGALFTCMTTRAVHVELAASLSTDSMILALRRMAARRGMPKSLFSDNGTNFVGANKELKEAAETLKTAELTTEADKIGVRWKFTAPGAPNQGGAWERLVRSIKTALAVTLREKFPQEEVLHTLITEAEHIVNSRPLVGADENPEEEALTPNHFLLGRSCGARRIGAFSDADLAGRKSWRSAQRLADHFWSRWVREYLPTLLPRRIDGRASARDLRCGDTVLIVDATLPRCVWPRGQIVGVHPGPDGRTRVVEVQTTNGVLRRPSSKVVLLVPAASPGQEDGAAHEGEDVGDATSDSAVNEL